MKRKPDVMAVTLLLFFVGACLTVTVQALT